MNTMHSIDMAFVHQSIVTCMKKRNVLTKFFHPQMLHHSNFL